MANLLVQNGSFTTKEWPKTNNTNLFSPGLGSFETDTESWIVYGTNTIERDTTNPFIGNASLKITYVDSASGAYLTLANATDLSTDLTVGSWYRITGHARVNTGSVAVYIDGQAAGTVDTYTINSTDWEFFHLDFRAGHITDCRLKMTVMGGTEIIWLDNIVIQEMPPIPQGTKYVQAVTDGDFSFGNNNSAYGEWEFSLYKDDTLNTLTVQFISDSPLAYPNYNGYRIRLDSGEKLTLVKVTGGGIATLFSSAHRYTLNVWWDIKVTRSLDGEFHVYSRNTSVGGKYHLAIPSGPTSNPVTDNTFKTSQYGVVEADTGDKIAGFRHRLGTII